MRSTTDSAKAPQRSIQRVRCSSCGRTWAVYEGRLPRLWSLHGEEIFCDRRPCNAELERARTSKVA